MLRRFSIVSLLMLSLGSTTAFAAPNFSSLQTIAQAPPESDFSGRDGGQMFERLNLTSEQKQRMQAIRDQYKDQLSQRRQALRQAQQELMNLMAGTAPDSQIREKHRQVMALKQQMSELQFESMLAMRAILTPQQRQQLSQLMQERREAVRNRMRNGGMPR